MGAFSIWHIAILVVCAALFVIPACRIFSRAGLGGGWGLLAAIPIVNIVLLWVLAFAEWPTLTARQNCKIR